MSKEGGTLGSCPVSLGCQHHHFFFFFQLLCPVPVDVRMRKRCDHTACPNCHDSELNAKPDGNERNQACGKRLNVDRPWVPWGNNNNGTSAGGGVEKSGALHKLACCTQATTAQHSTVEKRFFWLSFSLPHSAPSYGRTLPLSLPLSFSLSRHTEAAARFVFSCLEAVQITVVAFSVGVGAAAAPSLACGFRFLARNVGSRPSPPQKTGLPGPGNTAARHIITALESCSRCLHTSCFYGASAICSCHKLQIQQQEWKKRAQGSSL